MSMRWYARNFAFVEFSRPIDSRVSSFHGSTSDSALRNQQSFEMNPSSTSTLTVQKFSHNKKHHRKLPWRAALYQLFLRSCEAYDSSRSNKSNCKTLEQLGRIRPYLRALPRCVCDIPYLSSKMLSDTKSEGREWSSSQEGPIFCPQIPPFVIIR
jgi:hypothetical protein